MKQTNPYPLRLEETLSKKLKKLSKINNRSYNKEIEWILRNYINKLEIENGEIIISDDEQL